MRLNEFHKPQLLLNKAEELSLSNQALLDLTRAVLDKDVPLRFHAKGNSMTPFIRDKDIITISPLRDRTPRVGDIVAFIQPETGRLVVHRIIARRKLEYLIKGDANIGSSDGFVAADSLLGQVTSIERNGRKIQLGLGSEKVLIVLLSRLKLLVPLRKLFSRLNQRKLN